MENDIKKLIVLTLNQLKTDLEKSTFPIEKYFDDGDNLILLTLKEIDNVISLSVGVNKKGTDLLFSNFLADGTLSDIKLYLEKTNTVDNILKTIKELILKIENYD